ncbi:hypothetical protein [Glycomyces rhizosphaerae]|uniref:Uncharacterized protein n=1 Tax=Glycomyces rhizosphaerae TaxID=2054422 RepID=A0ABV7PSH5_9ACTN
MSPDSDAVKWIILALALLQTAAALLQLAMVNGRARPAGAPVPLDQSVKLGLTLLPFAVAVVVVLPHMPATAEQDAVSTMEVIAIFLALFGPVYVGYVMGYNGLTLVRPAVAAGSALANATALAAGSLILFVTFAAVPPNHDDYLLNMLPPGAAALGFCMGVSACRTANRDAEQSEHKTDDAA